MLKWDLSGPDVQAADAAPWDGPFAGAVRPFTIRALVPILVSAGLLFVFAGLAGAVASYSHGFAPVNLLVVRVGGWYSVVAGVGLLVLLAFLPPLSLRRLTPLITLGSVLTTPVLISVVIASIGPSYGDLGTIAYVEAPLFAVFMCRLRWALLSVGLVLVGYGAVVTFQDGWPIPLARWAYVATVVVSTSITVGLIAAGSDRLARSEQAARTALADLNAGLEQRVDRQVAEIERLGQLRRFLSPQVADALMSAEASSLSDPHRRRIAVFFCDLRGFTAFTNGAEPEDVIGVLDEYYTTVGRVLHRQEATVGGYAGDGIMAYLGDPVRRDDAAAAMVATAAEVAAAMDGLVAAWRRRGFDLGFGIGIGFGFATLGVVGFDGRHDYTPIGGVVNLAARLCAKAAAGEILLDQATYVALDGQTPCDQLTGLELKGFTSDTPVYRLAGERV